MLKKFLGFVLFLAFVACMVTLILAVHCFFYSLPGSRTTLAIHSHRTGLPDLALTPGHISHDWTLAETKAAGGTQHHRKVSLALKRQVWERYGYDRTIGPYEEHSDEYEIDHLIPNCLGGASDLENLWPQPCEGTWNAKMKDRLEKHVRGDVMAGRLTLTEAQKLFTPDWRESFKRLVPAKEAKSEEETDEEDVQ